MNLRHIRRRQLRVMARTSEPLRLRGWSLVIGEPEIFYGSHPMPPARRPAWFFAGQSNTDNWLQAIDGIPEEKK